MTKTLEQIQEENRKVIIMANNPEAKDYDEALEMELGFGCKIICTNPKYRKDWIQKVTTVYDNDTIRTNWDCLKPLQGFCKDDVKIIGKPLDLGRLLMSFPSFVKLSTYDDEHILTFKAFLFENVDKEGGFNLQPKGKVESVWDLTKPTLEEQTEETQREIHKLLNNINLNLNENDIQTK